ncbi:hypothetical protein BASA81_003321 [Batrachochytrium salamandrivorans]|nr:hypothetical protein BASA81_003321 [Batrachochytrium salamandrivorans]
MSFAPACLDAMDGIKLASCLGGVYLQHAQATSTWLGDSDASHAYRSQIVRLDDGHALVIGAHRLAHLQVWVLPSLQTLPREISTVQECQGFGHAAMATTTTGRAGLYLATGLGLGTARVWHLDLTSEECVLVLKCKAKYNTILALHVDPRGYVFVGTKDGFEGRPCCQQWNIISGLVDQKAKHLVAIIESKTKIREQTSELFLNAVLGQSASSEDVESFIKSSSSAKDDWASMFPAEVLDPMAYVGETDLVTGLAHGQGRQRLENGLVFRGTFAQGKPQQGTLEKPSRDPYFTGSVDNNALPHGHGTEHRTNGEIYVGGFKHGLRHGMFASKWKCSPNSINYGVFDYGFYFEGKRHGLAWRVWHETSHMIPFAGGREREMRKKVGTLGCIQVVDQGELKYEFNFYCLSGQPLVTAELKQLVNIEEKDKETGELFDPPTFQPNPSEQGVYTGTVCWACMEEDGEEEATMVCLSCCMRVHRRCAWPEDMFTLPRWHGRWLCPRCEATFDCDQVVVLDRHNQQVVVSSKDELDRLDCSDSNASTRVLLARRKLLQV